MPKTNPRKIPRSEADVLKAYERGIAVTTTATLLIMKDKLNADDEHIAEFAHWLEVYLMSLDKKRIDVGAIKSVLADEYDMKVVEAFETR